MHRFAARSGIAQRCLTWNCIAWCCTMMCCRVPCCIALPDLKLGCMYGAAFPRPILHCAALPRVTSCHLPCHRVAGCTVLCCAAGRCAALYCLILDCIAWSHTASRFALHRPALPALELHSSAPWCTVPCCCPALPTAAQAQASPGCLLPACITPSHLVPRCLSCPMLAGPARTFLVPYGVVLPGLLPAAPPWALLHAMAFSSPGLQSLRCSEPVPCRPFPGPCLTMPSSLCATSESPSTPKALCCTVLGGQIPALHHSSP